MPKPSRETKTRAETWADADAGKREGEGTSEAAGTGGREGEGGPAGFTRNRMAGEGRAGKLIGRLARSSLLARCTR